MAVRVGVWQELARRAGAARHQSGGRVSDTEYPGRARHDAGGGDAGKLRTGPTADVVTVGTRRAGDCWVVSARGEVDLGSFREVEAALNAVRGTSSELVLDLREVEFLDTSGLRLILMEQERARSGGYRFVVVRGPDKVQRLFELAGLTPQRGLFVDSPAEVCGP
jgi:anti-anti-sigma factor